MSTVEFILIHKIQRQRLNPFTASRRHKKPPHSSSPTGPPLIKTTIPITAQHRQPQNWGSKCPLLNTLSLTLPSPVQWFANQLVGEAVSSHYNRFLTGCPTWNVLSLSIHSDCIVLRLCLFLLDFRKLFFRSLPRQARLACSAISACLRNLKLLVYRAAWFCLRSKAVNGNEVNSQAAYTTKQMSSLGTMVLFRLVYSSDL